MHAHQPSKDGSFRVYLDSVKTESKVWIVQHDERPDNTVLEIFASETEAAAFAEEIKHRFANGVIYSCFDVGYRFDQSRSRYRTPGSDHPRRHNRGMRG